MRLQRKLISFHFFSVKLILCLFHLNVLFSFFVVSAYIIQAPFRNQDRKRPRLAPTLTFDSRLYVDVWSQAIKFLYQFLNFNFSFQFSYAICIAKPLRSHRQLCDAIFIVSPRNRSLLLFQTFVLANLKPISYRSQR
jgi:hypothetical protein